MRIGLNTPDPQGISTGQTTRSSASESTASSASTEEPDTFSGEGRSLQALTNRALQTPPVRQDKVDSLRQSIARGQYRIDPNSTAQAMLNQ